MAPRLTVEIVGDTRALEKSFARAQSKTKGFTESMEGVGRGATVATVGFKGLGRSVAFASGAFLGGAGFASAVSASVDAASNLNEQISKTNVVFGDSAAEIQQWAHGSAAAMGLARDQALAVASSFGALFRPLGIVGAEATQQSEKLTQLGADLASFYNTDVQQALDAIRSGLVGESEPLRQYGILLSEARVQQQALNETGKDNVKQLTDAEKVLGRINLIYKDSKQAQGDFARTAHGAANEHRTLKANIRDLSATIGQKLLPIIGAEERGWNKVLGAINNVGQAQQQLDPKVLTVVVPRVAREIEDMRSKGIGLADAMKIVRREFNNTAEASDILAEALRFMASEDQRRRIERLRLSIQGLSVDAEAAAKATSMVLLHQAQVAAAQPRGEAAIGVGARLRIALGRAGLTATDADDLKVLTEQQELDARKIQSLQNRLARATGKKARALADQLEQVLGDQAAVAAQIASIGAARAAAASARRTAAKERHDDAVQAALGEAQFKIDQAALTKSLRDDLGALEAQKRVIQGLIRSEGATLELRRQLLAVEQDLAAVEKQINDTRNRRRNAAVTAVNQRAINQLGNLTGLRRQARAFQAAREQRQQFLALGLTGTGEERLPGIKALRKELGTVQDAVKGTILDTAANRSLFAHIRQVLTGEFGKVTVLTRRKVKEMLDAFQPPEKQGEQTAFKHLSPARLVDALGLNLSVKQRRRLEPILAQIGRGGTLPAGRTAAFAGAGRPLVVQTQVNLNGREIALATADDVDRINERRSRSRAAVRRGAR